RSRADHDQCSVRRESEPGEDPVRLVSGTEPADRVGPWPVARGQPTDHDDGEDKDRTRGEDAHQPGLSGTVSARCAQKESTSADRVTPSCIAAETAPIVFETRSHPVLS